MPLQSNPVMVELAELAVTPMLLVDPERYPVIVEAPTLLYVEAPRVTDTSLQNPASYVATFRA